MKRFTLIIDGHNFFYRSLWSCFRQGGKSKVLTTQKDIDEFEKKMMVEFANIVKMFSSIISDVIVVEDSHSWRKDLLLQYEYKGNRKKVQDDIDRNGFDLATGNFIDTIKKTGIKVSTAENSEGDDLIFAWTDMLFEHGKSSIIFSTDRDLNQLVKCVNDVHILQFSPMDNRLFVSKESNVIIQKLSDNKANTIESLFDQNAFTVAIENDPYERFMKSVNIIEIDPEIVRFKKIVGGDVSDNIYPVYYKPGDGTTRSKGLGAKTVDKIYNTFKERLGCEFNYTVYDQEDAVKLLCNVIYDVAKIKDEEFTRRMLFENIKTNTTLVSLTKSSIPEEVRHNMEDSIFEVNSMDPVIVSKITKDNLFSNSRFKDYRVSIQVNSNTLKGVVDDGDRSFIKG